MGRRQEGGRSKTRGKREGEEGGEERGRREGEKKEWEEDRRKVRGERVKRNRIIVFMRRHVIVEVEFTLRS